MIESQNTTWRPLGMGRISSAGALADKGLAQTLSAYKTQTARRYRSVSPADIISVIPGSDHLLSPKIDGETWFLHVQKGEARLLSPSGKIISGIPVTREAEDRLKEKDVLITGELHAGNIGSRSHVHDLHAAMGGGKDAQVDRVYFAGFDLLAEAGEDMQARPFPVRAKRLMQLLSNGVYCRCVPFQIAASGQEVTMAYDDLVSRKGHEGLVVHLADGQILKIKPEITIDAVVVGYCENGSGKIAELLVALMRPDGSYQLLGRINTGFTEADRRDLFRNLQSLETSSAFMAASRSGALFKFVRPKIIIEVKCNDVIAERANGDDIKRMALSFDQDGWQAVRPLPFVSLINAVYRRLRDDKIVSQDSIRISQVTDLVEVSAQSQGTQNLPLSTVLRREVYTKTSGKNRFVRKILMWKTNKETMDSLYPPFVIFISDYSPQRQTPLKTAVKAASCVEKAAAVFDAWVLEHTKGWKHHGASDRPAGGLPDSCHTGDLFRLDLEVGFGKTSSVNHHVAVRRIKALSGFGHLSIDMDDKAIARYHVLCFRQDALVENIRRIENLYRLISHWRSTEFIVNQDPLDSDSVQGVINAISEIADCWRRQKRQGNKNACASFTLGCDLLQFKPKAGFCGIAREEPAWYAVGAFDGSVVALDKEALLDQLASDQNEKLVLCPFFDNERVRERIDNLPDKLDPADESSRWVMGYSAGNLKPVWVFPKNIKQLPFDVCLSPTSKTGPRDSGLPCMPMVHKDELPTIDPIASSSRNIPAARYTDVIGQDEALDAVRDYAELPLKHPELFAKIGVRPGRGILLWGPPGTGKTLLARAVAGESAAHIEIISGPEILSKWIGESERQLREVFERAGKYSPSVILIDEIDSIAGKRDGQGFENQQGLVSQFLVLMDGISDRGRILVIAATNLPNMIDPAILRPGRIDRRVFMGVPSRQGRMAQFARLLEKMPLAPDIDLEKLAAKTKGFSGAEIEHAANQAGLFAIKDAVAANTSTELVHVGHKHFLESIRIVRSSSLLPN